MRYEDVPESLKDVVKQVINENFPELAAPGIMCVFDEKLKISKGKIILAQIKKANEVEKFLSLDDKEFEEGPDYIIFINKKAWELADAQDKIRLIRHELRHTLVDLDHEKNPYKIVPHDLEDFHAEVVLNTDKPRWAEDLGLRVKTAYEIDQPAPIEEVTGEER